MEILIAIFVLLCYLALFACVVIAAAVHMWFAFAGWLVAWLFATILVIVSFNQSN